MNIMSVSEMNGHNSCVCNQLFRFKHIMLKDSVTDHIHCPYFTKTRDKTAV